MPNRDDDRCANRRSFCTYFDSNYLDRGLCLWASLTRFYRSFRLFVCCFDAKAFDTLTSLALPGVVPVALNTLEQAYPQLLEVKPTRNRAEYFFTVTPSWIRYVLEAHDDVEEITYLDSDLLFFSSPEVLFETMRARGAQIGIIGHRFTEALQDRSIYGLYNVGWVTFRKGGSGSACLADWQRNCLDWCFDELEDDRFADQKYLDAWPSTYENVLVLDHPGANVALWNIERGTNTRRGKDISVRGQPLLFYHFHGLSQLSKRLFYTHAQDYALALDRVTRKHIYGRYLTMLRSAQKILRVKDVQPLIRYPVTREQVFAACRSPLDGNFLISWTTPRATLEDLQSL